MFGSNRFQVSGSSIKSVRLNQGGPQIAATRSKVESNLFGMLGGGGNSAMNIQASGPLVQTTFLNSIISESEQFLRKYYRDIYTYDAVAGTVVDLMANFPFSDFTLTGCANDRLTKYTESLTRLNIRALLPDLSVNLMVDGETVSSLIFNRKEGVFLDVVNYNVDDCTIGESPFYSIDGSIKVRNSQAMMQFMRSTNESEKAVRSLIPEELRKVFASPHFELDRHTTLYLARRGLNGSPPQSFLKRVLPIYLLEKTLYRGTIIEANKRQRSMLHVTMGDDTHTFTPEEMLETVNQFQMADLDPLGAVIGTRNTVQASELRSGGEFWRWDQTIDGLTPYKLRALGTSEAFLSADAQYANAESALSVHMENMDTFRSRMSYEIFTNKVFPIVAINNDFFKPGREVDTTKRRQMMYQMNNANDLEIPQIQWHKKLEARSEENVMDTLQKLEEKGWPIPMRMMAAAARIDINSYLYDLSQDEELKKKVAELSGKKEDEIGKPQEEGDGEFASISRLTSPVKRKNVLSREFKTQEVVGSTKTGKAKYIPNQRREQEKANVNIVKALDRLQDPHVRAMARENARKLTGR